MSCAVVNEYCAVWMSCQCAIARGSGAESELTDVGVRRPNEGELAVGHNVKAGPGHEEVVGHEPTRDMQGWLVVLLEPGANLCLVA